MRTIATIAILGLTVGCSASAATAESIAAKVLDAGAKSTAERAAVDSVLLAESKVRAAVLGHDADPSVDLASLKADQAELNPKFSAVAKMSAPSGAALVVATNMGGGEDPWTALGPAGKVLSAGAPDGVSRAGHQPNTENSAIKLP